jgi:dipeptidyl aminopeptidase/acylaminoacyl peptidase
VGDPVAGDYSEAMALNEHLAGVAEPERRLFDYESERGESLQGFLLLPPGYEGEPLPLIVDVYPMRVIYGLDRYDADTNFAGFNHLQRYTSRGFAVLVPSMPLPLDEAPIDPMLELAGTVLPAVDRAVELGIADPERLGLFGHSYGGYAVLGLLTQTDRFKAAVASAPYSDLAAYHRTIYPHYRYDEYANELAALIGAEFEDPDLSVLRLLSPPSGDLERYLRNSPVHHLDAVTTPLLLLHGEFDGVSLAQSEAVFMGLQRLGRRVSLARYWGEGHILNSPANLRDSWERTLDWFEELF